jgi:hypothetical protein
MALPAAQQLTLELVPHCTSVARDGWAVAASHGDVVPALLAALGSAFGMPRPRHVGRGGWHTLQFAAGDLAVTAHDPVPL